MKRCSMGPSPIQGDRAPKYIAAEPVTGLHARANGPTLEKSYERAADELLQCNGSRWMSERQCAGEVIA